MKLKLLERLFLSLISIVVYWTWWAHNVTKVKKLVSCLACVHLPVRNSLVNEVEFFGLIPQKRKDQ